MLKNESPWDFDLPESLNAGSQVISKLPMQEVSIDHYIAPDVLLETSDGLVKLPVAEGLLTLLSSGWQAPCAMTIGLTQFFLADGTVLLVCSELEKNKGLSVANAWPELAEYVLKISDISAPERTIFVEHYFSGSYSEQKNQPKDAFYLVEIVWRGNKAVERKWHHLPAAS